MSCNNHSSKSYAVKRLSNWTETGWKSWTNLSANRFCIFESYPKTPLPKNWNSMSRLRWDKSRKHAKIPSEEAVQETTEDFDFKILTHHVDCSVSNAKIAQGQTDLRCLKWLNRCTPCFSNVTDGKATMPDASTKPINFSSSKFLGYVRKSEFLLRKKHH